MSRRATRELIEAAAALEPADRALVNLWIHRGLDDDRLAALTGMSAVALQARRERILAGLGEQLGQSPDEVLAALRGADDDDGASDAGDADDDELGTGRPDVTATDGGLESPATVSTAGLPDERPVDESHAEPEPSDGDPQAEPDGDAATAPRQPSGGATTSTSRHRSRIWAGFTVGVAIVVAAVLVVLLAGGGSSSGPAADPTSSSPVTPTTTAPASATSTTTTSTASATTTSSSTATTPRRGGFSGLPGPNELTHVSGVVRLVGKAGHLKLKLTVKGLPLVHHAHYEAWLFNSVVDSRALGHVTRDKANLYRLPLGARRFHFIDVSVQGKGTSAHSGASEVRAANPVDGPKDIVHRARARKPHPLHRAHGAAGHAAHAHRTAAPHSTHRPRGSHQAAHHRARHHGARQPATRHHRRGKRSSKAKTS
jgi:hypothetical protein